MQEFINNNEKRVILLGRMSKAEKVREKFIEMVDNLGYFSIDPKISKNIAIDKEIEFFQAMDKSSKPEKQINL